MRLKVFFHKFTFFFVILNPVELQEQLFEEGKFFAIFCTNIDVLTLLCLYECTVRVLDISYYYTTRLERSLKDFLLFV